MNRWWLLAVTLCMTASLSAQTQPAAQSAPDEEEPEREPAYVRRISVGISGGGNPWYLIGGGKMNSVTTSPALDTTGETVPKDHYVFGGGLLQFAILENWTVNAGVLYRTAEFEWTRTILSGVDNPNTIKDERSTTTIKDATKARLFDFPLLIRRYNIGRHEYGHRWFIEGGPSLRQVSKIRTKRETTLPGKDTETDSAPTPHKKNVLGVTAGIGGQFIDPIGVRVIPEVRYTKWFGRTFDSLGMKSRVHQLDIMISFSF
ncbi:MAG: outer membrane beta-barrel protein [Bryobacteraceae bacterium]